MNMITALIMVLRYYFTDQKTPLSQSQMITPLTIVLCLIILPLVILCAAAAAASGPDNGSKPHDKSLSLVIIYNSSFHPLFVLQLSKLNSSLNFCYSFSLACSV